MTLVLGDSVIDDELYNSLSTMDKLKKRLKELGLSEPPLPMTEHPIVPKDLDSLSDQELGALHSHILEHFNYTSYQYALYQCNKAEADNKVKYIKSKLKSLKSENIESSAEFIESVRVQQEIEQVMIMVEALRSILSKQMAVVSRNVEIRKLDWEKNKNVDAVRSFRRFSGGAK